MRLARGAWPLLPACIAFLYALWLTSVARGAPDYDYWDMFTQLLTDDGFNITLGTLYDTSNEHIVVLAKLTYLANHALTGGDNFGLSAIACTFALVIATVFARMFSATAESRTEALLLGALAAVAAFTPMAAHNFFIGMSGVAWLGANMLAVLALAAFLRGHSRNSFAWIALSFCIALLAGQFYSTGVVAMLAVGAQGLALPRTRRVGLLFLVAGLGYLLVVYLMQKVPTAHGDRTFGTAAIWAFTTTFIGAGLTRSLPLAQLWGTLGVATLAILSTRFVIGGERHRPSGAFWIAIASFALMNGGIAAIGRAAMGAEAAAMASRYASLPSLFWIGLLGLSLSFRREDNQNLDLSSSGRFAVRGVVVLGCIGALTLIAEAGSRVEGMVKRSAGKPAAGLALALGVHDEALVRTHVTSVPIQIWQSETGLRKVGQVPFNRMPDCPTLGTRLALRALGGSEPLVAGYLDRAKDVGDGWFRVEGWALEPTLDRPPLVTPRWPFDQRGCLVIVDEEGTVVGIGLGGEERPDVAAHFGREDTGYGWVAFARQPSAVEGPTRIQAAVRDRSGTWVQIPHHIELTRDAKP